MRTMRLARVHLVGVPRPRTRWRCPSRSRAPVTPQHRSDHVARAQHAADVAACPDRAPAALFSCSPSGTVLTAGTELARLTGRPLGALPGVPAHELLHPSSLDLLRYVLRTARDGAASGAATLRLR